jgi:hypothetical protein
MPRMLRIVLAFLFVGLSANVVVGQAATINASWWPAVPANADECTNNQTAGYKKVAKTTDRACVVLINRDAAISPPAIVIPHDEIVYIKLTNVHWDEAIAFNAVTVHAAPQDFATNALKSLAGPISSFVAQQFAFQPNARGRKIETPTNAIDQGLNSVYDSLQGVLDNIQNATTQFTCLETYKPAKKRADNVIYCDQSGNLTRSDFDKNTPSSALAKAISDANDAASATKNPLPNLEIQRLDNELTTKSKECTKKPLGSACYSELDKEQSLQNLYKDELKTLQTAQGTLLQVVQSLDAWKAPDDTLVFKVSLSKNNTATITITGTEFLTKTATTIGTVTVNSTAPPFVISTGLMFTWNPLRNYAISDQIVDGVLQVDPNNGNKPLTTVTKTTTTPAVTFPMVLASYRIPFLSRAKWEIHCPNGCSFLIGGGAGLNLAGKTADLAGGFSFQIGSFLVSPLAVGKRQNNLLDGVYVNQTSFGSNPPSSLPIGSHWTVTGGISITYVVPLT